MRATLFIFSGLPGVGKSSLAAGIARRLHAVHLRIDTIEQALRDQGQSVVEDEGYRLAYRIAADNLRLGMSVVADACNPIELTRRAWKAVAAEAGADSINIEILCSDAHEHRVRVTQRASTVAGLVLPTWREVQDREYEPWAEERLVLDTAGRAESESLDQLTSELSRLIGC